MRETLEKVLATDPTARVESFIFGEYGDSKMDLTNQGLGYFSESLPRGVGICWKNQVNLHIMNANPMTQSNKNVDELRELIVTTYQAVATTKALESLEYAVQQPYAHAGKLRVEAARA